ncbi:MAG: hypothetical protein WA705_19170 [Candidatus Ozemobacteraceae bacterium]
MRTLVVLWLLAELFMMFVADVEQPIVLDEIVKILRKAETAQRKRIPKSLLSKNAPLERGEYGPNSFLAVFPRLSLESGQILDFVYDFQELGGHPIVYARSTDRVPFSCLAEFKKEFPRRYFLGDKVRFDPFYLRSIRADDNPDGFLQLAMLVLTGEQFYIHWHAVYYIFRPVMDRATLDDIVRTLPEDLRKQAGAIDFAPQVLMGKNKVNVQFVVFCPWQGFTRITWTVGRAFPHRFIRVDERILLPYKNPLRF